MTLHELFVEPWLIGDWMWRGVLTSSLVAVVCGLLGPVLYLRRLSMMSDALAHVALLGIVVAYLLTGSDSTVSLLLGAVGAGVVTTVLVGFLQKHSRTRPDAAIGIVFTALFALGVILLSAFASDAHLDVNCVLFGNVLGVADHSMWTLGIVTAVVFVGTLVFYRPLMVATFDPAYAAAVGLPVTLIGAAVMGALSVTTVACFEAVGAILVVAALITPAATAHLLCRRFHTMLLVSVGHGIISAVAGMYTAIWIDCTPAGAMVTVGGGIYALVLIGQRIRRAARRRRVTAAA